MNSEALSEIGSFLGNLIIFVGALLLFAGVIAMVVMKVLEWYRVIRDYERVKSSVLKNTVTCGVKNEYKTNDRGESAIARPHEISRS